MAFSAGSLVKVRGREWVVLPDSQDDFLIVRPLGGTDAEVAGIDMSLESVEEARFALPDPVRLTVLMLCDESGAFESDSILGKLDKKIKAIAAQLGSGQNQLL